MRWLCVPFVVAVAVLAWNEWLVYYVTLSSCDWPDSEQGALRAFFIADTHLLGVFKGHWFDKLRREWQMHRAFQTAKWMLDPDTAFFLGDLMDEGKWTNQKTFSMYATRFGELFGGGDRPKLISVAGNHDIGFHYELNPSRVEWFREWFGRESVELIVESGQPFVLVTSMALEGDGCRLCADAERRLREIARQLRCASNASCVKEGVERLRPYRQPIVLQHFPLYRQTDAACVRDADFDHDDPTRDELFKEGYDCLTRAASASLIGQLRPRAVFDGHTHRGCRMRHNTHDHSFWEYTVNSFSWRNGDRPSLLLASISAHHLRVSVCHLPRESTVIYVYIALTAFSLLYVVAFITVKCGKSQYRILEFKSE